MSLVSKVSVVIFLSILVSSCASTSMEKPFSEFEEIGKASWVIENGKTTVELRGVKFPFGTDLNIKIWTKKREISLSSKIAWTREKTYPNRPRRLSIFSGFEIDTLLKNWDGATLKAYVEGKGTYWFVISNTKNPTPLFFHPLGN